MTRRATTLGCGALTLLGIAVASCGVNADVATQRSDRIGGAPSQRDAPATAPAATSVEWSQCDPPPTFAGTSERWQCATLPVAMDPFGDSAGPETVELALTRHEATGDRRGSLLINPGGPGGSGLELAWGLRSVLPAEILLAFDVVSWDPRGVGRSTPPISCGDDADPDDDFLMTVCASSTGELTAFLSAPYSAADMESIRIALGEARLDYLGYSYGATLGASYAALFPDTVGRFVLDGVTDPSIGGFDGFFEDGFPFYAEDGLLDAAHRFEGLCDLSDRCGLGPDTAAALEELRETVDDLPTGNFDDGSTIVTREVVTGLLQSSLEFSGDWELLATALGDAYDGDASALASLTWEPPFDEAGSAFDLANLVIYCADFRHVITEWSYCDGIPRNVATLEPVAAVDVDELILVIGTEHDPLTPGKHAPAFAAALGDAVHVMWDGVGHTAFPAPTACINDVVTDFLIDGFVPVDGLRCPFVDGVADDAALADVLFGHGDIESEDLLLYGLFYEDEIDDFAACVATTINQLDDRTISHVVLGVTSEQAAQALDDASASC